MKGLRFTRREFIKGALAAALLPSSARFSLAANPVEQKLHGMSAFGELKYPAGFTQFEYAVTDAPKGGAFAFAPSNWSFNQNVQTFNTLNTFVLQGEAPPRMEYCFDTLMTEAWDEPDALYGQLASSVTISADRNTFRFDLRPEAKFHDGSPVMASDMAWSLMTLKEFGHPQLALDLVNLDAAEAVEDHVLELRFNGKQSDRAILAIAATAPVFSRAAYGSARFDETTSEAPMSSGPYRVKRASTGQFIEYEKVPDYWGHDLPVMRGLDHFDVLRIDFFTERQAAFEAFKKGEILWRQEFTSKTWATEYDFPAVRDGRVRENRVRCREAPAVPGLRAQYAAREVCRSADPPGNRHPVRFRMDQPQSFLRRLYSAPIRCSSGRISSPGASRREAELKLLEPLRDKLPDGGFRHGGHAERHRWHRPGPQHLPQGRQAFRQGRLEEEGRQARRRRWQAAFHRSADR